MASKKLHKWEIFVIRKKAERLGVVEAPDQDAAIKIAIAAFGITDPERQKRLSAQRMD